MTDHIDPIMAAPPEQNEMGALLDAVQEYNTGDIITAQIVSVQDDRLLLDTGTKAEGILPKEEISFARSPSTRDFRPGEMLEVMCIKKTEDTFVFSKKRVDEKRVWERAEDAREKGKRLKAKVVHPVKGGLIVDIDGPAFLPQSHADIKRLSDEALEKMVGEEIEVKVLEIDPEKNRLVVSRRKVMEEDLNSTRISAFNAIQRGDTVTGTVEKVVDFGVFVNLGEVSGLLPLSEIAHERVMDPSKYFKVGDPIEVKVIKTDPDRRRISLSRRAMISDPWDSVKDLYREGDVVTGKVARLKDFGAFIKLPDGYFEGLAHISELVNQRINHPKEVFSEGDEVDVLVLGVDAKKKRIKLSVKRAADRRYKEELRELEKEWKSDKPLTSKLNLGIMLTDLHASDAAAESAAAAAAEARAAEPGAAAASANEEERAYAAIEQEEAPVEEVPSMAEMIAAVEHSSTEEAAAETAAEVPEIPEIPETAGEPETEHAA